MTKFANDLAEVLYEATLDSLQYAEMGSVDELGWYALFDLREFVNDPVVDGILPTGQVFAIVEEDSQGFVSVKTFESRMQALIEWSSMGDAYDNFYRNQDAELDKMVNEGATQ